MMCDQVTVIFKAIEFIESHLQEEISVAQIADAAGYSLFHFMRKFNQVVHHTPYDYLMRRRLTEAARALIQSDQRIIDVAQDFGFNDQETFSRVFRKMFQMTPSQCRKEKGVPLPNLLQAKTMEELYFINSTHFSAPLVVEMEGFELSGLMTALDQDAKTAAVLCEKVRHDFLSASGLKANLAYFEIDFFTDQQRSKRYYFVGNERQLIRNKSPLMVSQTITPGRFATMQVPEPDLLLATAYLYSTWLPRVGLVVSHEMIIYKREVLLNTDEWMMTLLIPVK